MRYYLIAGEASGDLHGSNLIKELKLADLSADIRCWGGDKMEAAGATLVKHYKDLAFMGFTEVLQNLGTILKNLKFCKEDILQYRPDAIILIDYPGFNLRIAKWAKEEAGAKGLSSKIIYYISPQVWAWKENRVKMMKQCIDKMICILPFEKKYYKERWNWEVEYVGHPLVEVVDSWPGRQDDSWPMTVDRSEHTALANDQRPTTNEQQSTTNEQQSTTNEQQSTSNDQRTTSNDQQPTTNEQRSTNIIALLPGSRKQEILKKLPIMLEVAKYFPDYQFVVAKAPGLEDIFYDELLRPYNNVSAVANKTYALLSRAKAALVTSGTATLETALFGVPEVICYKGNKISYQIAKRLIKIKFIGLVNLIMDKEVVKELIQQDLTVKNLQAELNELLNNKTRQQQVTTDYAKLKAILSEGGHASENAARSIFNFLSASATLSQ